ncbi:hypothetical protein PGT21_029252 [Puccinia graminis f. sp. tritici]|uniref:Uncharacterized protein n=1 Tax=Puccinia graminis f. sp. tritici TaxID=56615 RepID=A0A5B0RQC8_PUCGR|nr:hypothetical protein PGT21_029252 [Puccinia graminis f. sp. tritici]KAA1128176.1 hypothetical protein PGTUg99_019583 [Puccinia graminis f. sp. tritici]
MVLTTRHHLDGFRTIQVMLGAPEHPLDAFIASHGHSCSENNHWMYRFSKNPPRGVADSAIKTRSWPKPLRASPTVLLMQDLGPTSAGREALLVASGAAKQAAEHCGGGPKLPLAAEFGSFGHVSPTPAQLHSHQRQADPPPDC